MMINLMPELSMLFFSIVFLFVSFGKKRDGIILIAKVLSTIIFGISLSCVLARGEFFGGAYRLDLFSQLFKTILIYGFCFVIFMLDKQDEIEDAYLAEYIMFIGFSMLGLMMLVSSVELISIVIALEISSYSLYVVVPLRKGHTEIQIEASIKYFFFGTISTALMLFGMGYVYGLAKSTFLNDIMEIFPRFLNQPVSIFALILTLTGFFFKLSIFPMHFWAPDIYEGASNRTTTFIATIPKIASAALLIRITLLAASMNTRFVNILIVLAALSMIFGNLVGLVQKDIKRLLAYSGIAHAGYLLMGVMAMNKDGYASVIYYITVYLFMNLACFFVLVILSRDGKNVVLDDLAGLSRRAPLLAFTLAIGAFSLAGIPPTGGFTGKLFLFMSAFSKGYLTIVIIGAVNTVVSIFFYLNLVRVSYSKDPKSEDPVELTSNEKVLCYIMIFLILYMGILPYGLFDIFKLAV